jgi:hypothetical protein
MDTDPDWQIMSDTVTNQPIEIHDTSTMHFKF